MGSKASRKDSSYSLYSDATPTGRKRPPSTSHTILRESRKVASSKSRSRTHGQPFPSWSCIECSYTSSSET